MVIEASADYPPDRDGSVCEARHDIERVWYANWQVYGAAKVWKQMRCEDIRVAHCPVERLTRSLGLHRHTR